MQKKIIWKRNKKHVTWTFHLEGKYLIHHNNSTKQSSLQMTIIKIAEIAEFYFLRYFLEAKLMENTCWKVRLQTTSPSKRTLKN